MRFEDKQNCYLDVKTGLEWSKENFGPMSWNKAIKQFDGSNDWRLPTIEELKTLVDYTQSDLATDLPKMLSSYYWSSTTNATHTDFAWIVDFYYGNDGNYLKSNSYYVRGVLKRRIKNEI